MGEVEDAGPEPAPVRVTCADGVTLVGHFLPGQGEAQTPVLISPATGVKQQFYFRFARHLARLGHPVLVFDYRGVGLSLSGPLRDSQATLTQWGQLDQPAALAWLVEQTGVEQVVLLGHSAGGQMIGLLPNHGRVRRLVGVAASTGWFGGMRPWFRWKARLGLRILLPLGTLIRGHAPTAALGLGENLPAGVGRQWGQWCAAGRYATNAVRHTPQMDHHAEVRCPVEVFHASDDDIATSATVADLLGTWPNAPQQVHRLRPQDFGLTHIGHLDWFRQSHRVLWPLIVAAIRRG